MNNNNKKKITVVEKDIDLRKAKDNTILRIEDLNTTVILQPLFSNR